MKTQKLLIFHPIIAPYRIDMVNELAKNFDVTLCLYAYNLQGQKFDIAKLYDERMRVKPEFLLDKKYNGKSNIRKAMVDAIHIHQPDIVIVSEFSRYAWVVLLHRLLHRLQYKVVSLVDDSIDMLLHTHSVFVWHSIARRITMPLLDQVINVDPRAAEWYQCRYGKGIFFPIVSDDVIYRERLKRVLPLGEEYVEKYQLEGKKILMFVGRLSREKNIPAAIDAFKHAKISDSIFIIIGDGPEKEALIREFGNEESVIFAGRYEGDALYAWYNVAQVLILPSLREPFGAVTNEALMAGCWVLLSNVAGSGCLIRDDETGNFIFPQDKNNISLQIVKALDHSEQIELPLKVKSDRMIKPFREYIKNFICAIKC